MKGEDKQMFSKAQEKTNLLMEENICFTRGRLSVQTTCFFFSLFANDKYIIRSSLYSSMVERNTVNILINVRFILKAFILYSKYLMTIIFKFKRISKTLKKKILSIEYKQGRERKGENSPIQLYPFP